MYGPRLTRVGISRANFDYDPDAFGFVYTTG